jgi:hypothetical protein
MQFVLAPKGAEDVLIRASKVIEASEANDLTAEDKETAEFTAEMDAEQEEDIAK